jgi:hypothetical protein
MQIQVELSDRLKQIAADNARCIADIIELKNRRKFEVSGYQRKGMAFLDLQEELNKLLDNTPNITPVQQDRIYELTGIIQDLPPLKRPDIEEMDAFLLLNYMKVKENMRATQVALVSNLTYLHCRN